MGRMLLGRKGAAGKKRVGADVQLLTKSKHTIQKLKNEQKTKIAKWCAAVGTEEGYTKPAGQKTPTNIAAASKSSLEKSTKNRGNSNKHPVSKGKRAKNI